MTLRHAFDHPCFRMATAAGVLCEDPLVNVQFNLIDVYLGGVPERHWSTVQVMLATRRAIVAS